MKNNILFLFFLLLFPLFLFGQKRNSNRYIKTYELKSSVTPVYRFTQRTLKYSLNDLAIPFTNKKINLALDNRRQNSNFDMVSELYGRFYFANVSYSMSAGLFDKHIFVKLIKLKNGDFGEILKKTHANHSFQAGINYLGIRQLFKKMENTDFQFNASVNAEFAVDFSDQLDMSQYVNLFEYQNLPELIIRNKKTFLEVQDFIISKYSLPNFPLYKGVCAKAEFNYRHFGVAAQYHFLKNRINSRINSFSVGMKLSF